MRRLLFAADSSGARPATRRAGAQPSGATSTSARLRSIAAHDGRGDVLGRARADAGRQLAPGVGEHAGVADEAGEDVETPTPAARRSSRSDSAKPRRPNFVAE